MLGNARHRADGRRVRSATRESRASPTGVELLDLPRRRPRARRAFAAPGDHPVDRRPAGLRTRPRPRRRRGCGRSPPTPQRPGLLAARVPEPHALHPTRATTTHARWTASIESDLACLAEERRAVREAGPHERAPAAEARPALRGRTPDGGAGTRRAGRTGRGTARRRATSRGTSPRPAASRRSRGTSRRTSCCDNESLMRSHRSPAWNRISSL